MRIPDWYALVLLSLAAFRVWKLLGEDTILDRPRNWLTAKKRGGEWAGALLECPWCAGFWISLAWWGSYEAWPHGALIAAAPWAISALVGVVAHLTSD